MTASLVAISQLPSLKKSLMDIFPSIKSSHLSEAISYGLGFNTHAAQRAAMSLSGDAAHGQENLFNLSSEKFVERLVQFGYDLSTPFSFDQIAFIGQNSSVPEKFRNLVIKISELESNLKPDQIEISRSRSKCIEIFSGHFKLGTPVVWEEVPKRVCLWTVGITHLQTRKKGWAKFVESSNSYISFPSEDHSVSFVHRLPLSNGKFVDYIHAVISMPYINSMRFQKMEESRILAENIGWTTDVLPDWTWYQSKATTLVLYQRSTSKEAIEQLWEGSFKKWLIENRSFLKKGMERFPRLIVDDAIHCQHMPLDLVDFEDCANRYLNEYVFQTTSYQDSEIEKVFEKLFKKWQKSKVGL